MEQDPYLMNRVGNAANRFQKIQDFKRVLCVCSAGLLRSPTAAVVLSQEPWNFNTRAAGLAPEFALIPVDQVLLEWSDEVVCMTRDQAYAVTDMLHLLQLKTPVVCLNIPDNFSYRDPALMELIASSYRKLALKPFTPIPFEGT